MTHNPHLQKLLDKGGKVVIPPGEYWVDAVDDRLQVRSGTHLVMRGVTLRCEAPHKDDGYGYYAVLEVKNANDVLIDGGVIIGDRKIHNKKRNPKWPRRPNDPSSPYGEWGHGLSIRNAKRVRVEGTKALQCWGDGFYMHKVEDIKLYYATADSNRRQGCSIIGGKDIHVKGGVFSNTNGTKPSAGIDVEPDRPTDVLRNILIERATCVKNRNGIEFALKKAASAAKNIYVKNCKLKDNDDRSIKSDTFSWWMNFITKWIDLSTIRIK